MKISKKIYFLSRNRQKMKFLSKKKFNGHVVPSPKYGSVLFQLWGGTIRPKIASFRHEKMTNSRKPAQYDSDQFGPENWILSGVSFLLKLIRGILSERYGLFRRFCKGNSTYCPAEGSPLSLAGLANTVRWKCTPEPVSIYSLSRPTLPFTASKSDLKNLRWYRH